MMSVNTIIALTLFMYMSVWFTIACVLKRNDVADIAWGLGFIVISWMAFLFSEQSARSLLVNCLVTIWGVRLTWHIAKRTLQKPEDRRYAAWRASWNYFYLRSYIQIFLLQGVFLYIILIPVLLIHTAASAPLTFLDATGTLVWFIGFIVESVSDKQLSNFLRKPVNTGKIMNKGLWAYSRHPNYFGEVLQWWGIFLIAAFLPNAFFSVVSPLLITFLILFVSGIPMLEKKYAGRADFEAYKKKTSIFIPLQPRK